MPNKRGHSDYVVFEREAIPSHAVVGKWRIGQQPQAWVDASKINVFRQTRGNVKPEDLEDLTRSLRIGDEISMIQLPTVGLFTVIAAKRYIRDLNTCWHTTHRFAHAERFVTEEPYSMAAIIAGHRRTAASYLIAQEITGEENPDLWLPVQYQVDPSFFEGLRTQYQENSHRSVPLWQDAQNIASTVRWGRKHGLDTYQAVAAYLGITVERVSNAISFDALPESIKHRVKTGSLTQESALYLERIGAASGLRSLEGMIDSELYDALRKKMYQRKLRVDELRLHLDEHGLYDEWEQLLGDELTRLLAKDNKSKYVAARSSELVGDGVLFSMDEDVDQIAARANTLLQQRRRLQPQALSALRILVSVIDADAKRLQAAIETPELAAASTLVTTPVIANSYNARNSWLAAVEAMQDVIAMELPDSEVLQAVRAVSDALTTIMSEASLEAVLASNPGRVTDIVDSFRIVLQTDGGSLLGIGRDLDTALATLSSTLSAQTHTEPSGGLFA